VARTQRDPSDNDRHHGGAPAESRAPRPSFASHCSAFTPSALDGPSSIEAVARASDAPVDAQGIVADRSDRVADAQALAVGVDRHAGRSGQARRTSPADTNPSPSILPVARESAGCRKSSVASEVATQHVPNAAIVTRSIRAIDRAATTP
jgi:hypothetical protein